MTEHNKMKWRKPFVSRHQPITNEQRYVLVGVDGEDIHLSIQLWPTPKFSSSRSKEAKWHYEKATNPVKGIALLYRDGTIFELYPGDKAFLGDPS